MTKVYIAMVSDRHTDPEPAWAANRGESSPPSPAATMTERPPCPECAPGATDPYPWPDTSHVHVTPYGYLVYAPEHEARSFIEQIRVAAYGQGRDDEAASADVPDWARR